MSVNDLKAKGNKAFAAKNYDGAIEFFSQALELDPNNHVLFSNRSAAHAGKKEWDAALEDAEKARTRSYFLSSNCGLTYSFFLPNSASTRTRDGRKATHARARRCMASADGTTPLPPTKLGSRLKTVPLYETACRKYRRPRISARTAQETPWVSGKYSPIRT